MANTITNRQVAFILLLTLTSFTVVNIPKTMAQSAGTGAWLTILAASVIFAGMAWLWAKLNAEYPDRALFDYGKELVGRAGVYVLAIFFILYFFTVLVNLMISMTTMLRANFLPETPMWAAALAAFPVIGFVAHKGISNVARLVEIYGVIFLSVAILVHILMLTLGEIRYILPLYNPAELGTYIKAAPETIYPFLGIETLSAIPIARKYSGKSGKTAVLTLLCIGVFYILIVETSIMMIGINEIVHYNYPLIVAIRQVELPMFKVFQRLDVLYLTVGFIGLFGGMSVVYLCIVEFVCRILPKARRSLCVAGIGAVLFMATCKLCSVHDIQNILTRCITYAGVVAAGAVPLALTVILKVKKRVTRKSC